MAAQPGVRYSFEEPYKYIESNLVGFFNILQNCKKFNVKKFIFASSSSVYGAEKKFLTLKIIQKQNQFNSMLQQNYLMKF